MKRILAKAAATLFLASHAFAGPYSSFSISTGTGKASQSISGSFSIAASSATASTPTIILDGTLGIISDFPPTLNSIASCSGALQTDSSGVMFCGTGFSTGAFQQEIDGLGNVNFSGDLFLSTDTVTNQSLVFENGLSNCTANDGTIQWRSSGNLDADITVSGSCSPNPASRMSLTAVGPAKGSFAFYVNALTGDTTPELLLDYDDSIYMPDLASCTAIETDGAGKLICGVDDTVGVSGDLDMMGFGLVDVSSITGSTNTCGGCGAGETAIVLNSTYSVFVGTITGSLESGGLFIDASFTQIKGDVILLEDIISGGDIDAVGVTASGALQGNTIKDSSMVGGGANRFVCVDNAGLFYASATTCDGS